MLPRIPRLLRQRRRQAEPQHWSAARERQGLWGIRLMLKVYKLFGRRAFQLLLYPVIGYFWLTGRAQRRASRDYLQRLHHFAQQRQQPLPQPLNSFRHFMRFGDAMLDKLASWQGELQGIRLVDRQRCQQQIDSGKGTLILASHLGDIESCRALGELGAEVKVNALVFTEHADRKAHPQYYRHHLCADDAAHCGGQHRLVLRPARKGDPDLQRLHLRQSGDRLCL